MSKQTLKIGDKVLFRSFSSNRSTMPIIKDLEVITKYSSWCNGYVTTDVTLEFGDGSTYRTTRDNIYKADKRTIDIFGKYKWDIAGVRQDNGYFGSYSCIEFDGKKAIVFCDDRDAIVQVVTDWYDDILYGKGYDYWSGDYRWNSDKPIVVYDKEKGYNLNGVHENKLLCDEWLSKIEPKWIYDKVLGYYVKGENHNGEKVIISTMGTIRLESLSNPKNIENVLKSVEQFSKEDVLHLWIEKDLPCAHIRGLEYKGSKHTFITKEQAIDLYKTHTNFKGSFNSVEWRVLDNQVTLLFRDYCDSDYD